MSDTSANSRIARNSVFMSVRMVIVLLLTLYTTRIVLHTLGIEDYGIYNVICGFVSMFSFLNTSMNNGIQRFFNYEYSRNGIKSANKVYCTSVIIQVILAVSLALIIEFVGIWYINSKMTLPVERLSSARWVFQFSVLSFCFTILQAPYGAAIMAHEKLDFYSVVNILDALLKLLIAFFIAAFRYDQLIIYGLLLSIISVIDFFLYYSYCKRHFIEIKFHLVYDRTLFRSMLQFSFWNIFGSFSGVMKEQGINLIMNYFFGPVVNAARGIAAQVNSGLQGFVANITVPVRPQITQSYAQGNISRTINLTYTISKLSCAFLYLMALPLSWEIDYVLRLWLGDNVPDHAGTFVIIILITSVLNNLNSAVSAVVHATGKMKLYQLSTSLTALCAIPIAYISLKFGGSPESALWAVVLTMIAAQTVAISVLKKLVGISILDYCRKVIFPLVLVFMATAWIPYFINHFVSPSFIRLLINVAVSCSSVMTAFYFVGLQTNEREMMNLLIKRIKTKLKQN